MFRTENKAISLGTTGSNRVNLFFKTVRYLKKEDLVNYLEKSWEESPQDTLKIIFYNRDCRGGKGEKKLFYDSLEWLYSKDIEMLMRNLNYISEYGYGKDYWELVERVPELKLEVCKLFAEYLIEDKNKLERGESVSIISKWAPSEGKKYDKKHNVVDLIRGFLDVSKRDYRKYYISPLRKHIDIVERKMCAQEWSKIKYSAVPSVAMNKSRKIFIEHDNLRYSQYLQAVKNGRTKINAGQLQPHELVRQYMRYNTELNETIECQWNALSKNVDEVGNFDECVVLSDVSGSMHGIPMEVSIALGIMISSKSKAPFTNKVITFHEKPKFFELTGETLLENVRNLMSAPWGGSTNFQKAINLILVDAINNEVLPEDMPKTLIVLSDMQFNMADCGNNFLTNFEAMKMKFAQYGFKLPRIVFWNVRANTDDFPVNAYQDSVSMISGFSPSILKAVFQGETEFTPYKTMRNAIDNERYSRLS